MDQIVFEIPAETPEGCFVPVHLRSGGAVSNSVTVAVRKEGGACKDSQSPLATAFAVGKKTGMAMSTGFRMRADTSVPVNRDFTGDFASVFRVPDAACRDAVLGALGTAVLSKASLGQQPSMIAVPPNEEFSGNDESGFAFGFDRHDRG